MPWITAEDKKAAIPSTKFAMAHRRSQSKISNQHLQTMWVQNIAVAVNSCTAALHLAMRALNIGPGDEVIVPDLTFAATANAPIFCGAKPVIADIDEETFNLSPKEVLKKITPKRKQ